MGRYDQVVEQAIWEQIQDIIIATGKFTADDWILEMKHPVIEDEKDTRHFAAFKLAGAVRLVSKSKLATYVKEDESILGGAMISAKKDHHSHNAHTITLEGIRSVDYVIHGDLKFSFLMEIHSTDDRIHEYIEGMLEHK